MMERLTPAAMKTVERYKFKVKELLIKSGIFSYII